MAANTGTGVLAAACAGLLTSISELRHLLLSGGNSMKASRDHAVLLSLPAAFAIAVARYPQRPAIIDGGVQTSYSELDELATRVSRLLAGSGMGPGRRVGLV